MQRLVWLFVFVLLGLALLICGLLVPAHLRAIDAAVIEQAGVNTRSLIEEGHSLLNQEKWGAAQMFWQVAAAEAIPHHEKLGLAVTNFCQAHPQMMAWGGADSDLEGLLLKGPSAPSAEALSAFDLLLRPEHRDRLTELLRISRRPLVQELLQARFLTNTHLFPPASSGSGQAFNSILLLTGFMLHVGHFNPALQDEIFKAAAQANRNRDSLDLERVCLDILSLSKRLNWIQFTLFIRHMEDLPTLRRFALLARENEADLPVLFTAVCLSGQPATVAGYLMEYPQTGMKDLRFGLGAGLGGLKELLAANQRIYYSGLRQRVVQYDPFGAFFYAILGWCHLALWAALMIKYLFYLAAGFLLARAYHYAKPAVSALEQPLQVPGLAPVRQFLTALCLLLVIFLLNEPFLAQESQQPEYPLLLAPPKVSEAVLVETPLVTDQTMNQIALLSLVLFFVLQALIYIACLIKLAEIRRQSVEPRLKLRLLENEDHLFDAGLYLGFVGTIIALILMSMGVVKPSLMAGYSSTSFGIIFVSILKIFHVRPLRRKLILESETYPA